MKATSSKFYSKSLTLVIYILKMINDNKTAKNIADILGMNKSHVSYYIKKSRKIGFVQVTTRDVFLGLELTQLGKRFLDQYEKNNQSVPVCRAENIRFRARVELMPTIPVDWKRIEMNHWPQYKSPVDGVRVKLNLGNSPVLEFLPPPLDGNDPFEIFVTLVFEVVNVILDLHSKTGLRVGPLQLGSRGEWLVYDPIARAFSKTNGQVTYEGISKVNASRPRSIGEFEFFDPRALLDYLQMPNRIKKIETIVERLECLKDEENKESHSNISSRGIKEHEQ